MVLVDHATVTDQHALDISEQAIFIQDQFNQVNDLVKFISRGWFAVTGYGYIPNDPEFFRYLFFFIEAAMNNIGQKTAQLSAEQFEVNLRGSASNQVRHLAINTAPVTGTIDIQVNAYR